MVRVLAMSALIAILVALASPFGPGRAHACVCGGTTAEQMLQADYLVIASSLAFDSSTPLLGDIAYTRSGTLVVETYLKGGGPQELQVRDPAAATSCAFSSYAYDVRLLMPVVRDGEHLNVFTCSNAALDTEYGQELLAEVERLLNPTELPPTGAAPLSQDESEPEFPADVGLALALAVPGLLLFAAACPPRRRS